MILVLGSSGLVGNALLRECRKRSLQVRAGYHLHVPTDATAIPVRVNLKTGEGLAEAMDGIDRMFLLCGSLPDQIAAEIRAIEAARAAGVQHIVKLSVLGAESESFSYARIHRPIERALVSSGIPYTNLRPNSFMQNFFTYYGQEILDTGGVRVPCGDARVSHIDVRDIARVATVALTQPGHENKAYDLTGPQALTFDEAMAIISLSVGRDLRCIHVTELEYEDHQSAMGTPNGYIDQLLELYRHMESGGDAVITTAVHDITGQDPICFDQFVNDHAGRFTR